MSLYAFLAGIDPRLTWPGILVLILLAMAAAVLRFVPAGFGKAWVRPATQAVAVALGVLAALQLGLAIAYFFFPRYFDWIEPTVVAASWIWWRGEHLYPVLGAGDVMGNWYGPVLFQLNGLLMWLLGPSIASSKLLGVAAFLAAQYVSVRVLRRIGASVGEALTITFVQCLLQAVFANQAIAFGVRADPLLLLAAECGVWAAVSTPSLANAALLGVLIGISGNLKVQGVFYLFPIFVWLLSRAASHADRARLFGVAALAGAVALAPPFAWGNASLVRYVDLFALAKHHGFSRWVFEKNIVFLALLWSPILWLWAMFRPKLPPGFVWFGAACLPAMAMVTMAGSIEASGPYNLLAFIPTLAWLFVTLLLDIRRQVRDAADRDRLRLSCLALAAGFLLGFAPDLALTWNIIRPQFRDAPIIRAARGEIETAMRRHPERSLEVGPGRYHDLRVIPVFHGNPLALDSETWFDMRIGGVDERVILHLIDTCRIDTWLLPAHEPILREYLAPDIYSPEVIADFRAHYRKEPAGKLMDAWRCIRIR